MSWKAIFLDTFLHLIFIFKVFWVLCVRSMFVSTHTYVEQRTTCWDWVSPSRIWVLEIKLKTSGMGGAGSFSGRAISSAINLNWVFKQSDYKLSVMTIIYLWFSVPSPNPALFSTHYTSLSHLYLRNRWLMVLSLQSGHFIFMISYNMQPFIFGFK